MKVLNKINKGLILTVLVMAALIIYLNNIEKQRNIEKTDIKKVCEEYIELTDKYCVLPENMQTTVKDMSDEKVKEYVKKMRADMEKIMINNEEAVNIQQKVLENNLYEGYNNLKVRTGLSRKIQKINSYEFEGNQVTINFISQVSENAKIVGGIEGQNENNSFTAYNDQITLQKVKGEWKIVYSNLQFGNVGNGTYFYDDIFVDF